MSFLENAARALRALDAAGHPYVVIGGVAAGVLGEPRSTYDLDILLFCPDEASGRALIDACRSAKIDVDPAEAMAHFREDRGFTLRSGDLHVDVLIADTAFEGELYARRRRMSLGGMTVSFPSPEDFILLKLLVGRGKDLLDAETVALRHRDRLDVKHIERWIDHFDRGRDGAPLRVRWRNVAQAAGIP